MFSCNMPSVYTAVLVSACVLISSYEVTSQIRLETHFDNHLVKGLVFKYNHILKYWTLNLEVGWVAGM